MERALHGHEVPVYSYGKLIGSRVVYNDRLLMFLLRNRAPQRFAADGAALAQRGGMNDPQDANRLSRLKRQWRKEWEAEWAAEQAREGMIDPRETCESIDAMLDGMQQRWLAGLTARTRALYEAYLAAEAEDKAAGRSGHNEASALEEAAEEVDGLDGDYGGGDPEGYLP